MRWPQVRPGEIAFALVGLPLAAIGALYVAATLYLGGLLAITIVGLPIAAGAVRGARALGALHRLAADRLLEEPIAPPPAAPRSRGLIGWVRSGLTDLAAWRILLYLLIRLPVAAVTFVAGFATWSYGAFLVGTPLYWLLWMRNLSGWFVATAFAAGLVSVGLAPWATRATADLNRWLARTLLAPAPASPRLQMLERARSEVAADATATLRRIERDLHDGTQARLVAISLSLAMADDALGTADVDRAQQLMQRARAQLGEASAELRLLTRGINPVALDGGLEEALPTLAADAGIPVQLHVKLPERPSPAIERVVYFCVAELLTNAAKHSEAESVRVEVMADEGWLRLRVSDDGCGGARLGAGTGLRGVRDRLEAVDGQLEVSSPAGGPTVITATLPVQL